MQLHGLSLLASISSLSDLTSSLCDTDVIDLTNDGEADDDLRRAMAASLQDHQTQQQSYRTPAAPSSTVGVSDITGWTEEEHEDAQMKQALRDSLQVAREHFDHSWTSWLGKLGALGFRLDYEGRAAGVRDRHDEMELVDVQDEVVEISDDEQPPEEEDRETIPELPSRGYRLRDRARLVKPNNAPQTLSEMGLITKCDRTYGRKTQSRGIGKGRRGRGVKRRGSWNLVRSPIDWLSAPSRSSRATPLTFSFFSTSIHDRSWACPKTSNYDRR